MPSFVVDITEPSQPRYCYLSFHNGVVKPRDYPARDVVVPLHHAPVYYHSILSGPQTYQLCRDLAEYGIVQLGDIISCWPFLAPDWSSCAYLNHFEHAVDMLARGVKPDDI
jgi:hypothetical protein